MIRFEYEGFEYQMQFQYEVALERVLFLPTPEPATRLTLTGHAGIVGEVLVQRYYKDNPCLEEARRAAIKKLCRDLARPLRVSLWRAYFSSHECKKTHKKRRVVDVPSALVEALRPFVRYAKARLELFGENSEHGYFHSEVATFSGACSLLPSDWKSIIAVFDSLDKAGV